VIAQSLEGEMWVTFGCRDTNHRIGAGVSGQQVAQRVEVRALGGPSAGCWEVNGLLGGAVAISPVWGPAPAQRSVFV